MSPVFRHGGLRLYLLKLLDEAPRHGYDVIRLLQDKFLGVYSPSPGTIYPRLARLEEEGLVTHETVDGKKVYRITDAGRAELNRRLDDLADLEEELSASVRDIAMEITRDVRETVRNLRDELTWAVREAGRTGRGTGAGPGTEGADSPAGARPSSADGPAPDGPPPADAAPADAAPPSDAPADKGAWGDATAEAGEAAADEKAGRPGEDRDEHTDEQQGRRGRGDWRDWTDWTDRHDWSEWVDWAKRQGWGEWTGKQDWREWAKADWAQWSPGGRPDWLKGGGFRDRDSRDRDSRGPRPEVMADLEHLAAAFAREIRGVARQAENLSDDAVGNLGRILFDTLHRIRTEVFRPPQSGQPRDSDQAREPGKDPSADQPPDQTTP